MKQRFATLGALLVALLASVTAQPQHVKRGLFAGSGKHSQVPLHGVNVGYFATCPEHNVDDILYRETHLKLALFLRRILKISKGIVNTAGCQSRSVLVLHDWNNLAKLNPQKNLANDFSMWELGYYFAYDAPPVVFSNSYRYVPVHLLKPDQLTTITTHLHHVDGHTLHISDDGGVRLVESKLFDYECQPIINTNILPPWSDPALNARRVVAIGDIHGDYDNLIKTLRLAKLINPFKHWSATNTILVQTGDLIDRGPDTKKVLEYMEKLSMQALEHGSRVIQLLGNHELMNLAGYVDPKFHRIKDDIPMKERKDMLSKTGSLGKRLRGLPLVHRVGDTIFAHGGISELWAQKSLYEINRLGTETLNSLVLLSMWFLQEPETDVQPHLTNVLNQYRASRMIVGHVPQLSRKITFRCERAYAIIDVAISRYMERDGGHISALEIMPNGVMNVLK
ncbi:Metallo-dependent phosphatase-like protein [Syncephalis plumigaleata]|nr:Metallo-dependent phosphatase-like protein [Syncephalis plumigaleata]